MNAVRCDRQSSRVEGPRSYTSSACAPRWDNGEVIPGFGGQGGSPARSSADERCKPHDWIESNPGLKERIWGASGMDAKYQLNWPVDDIEANLRSAAAAMLKLEGRGNIPAHPNIDITPAPSPTWTKSLFLRPRVPKLNQLPQLPQLPLRTRLGPGRACSGSFSKALRLVVRVGKSKVTMGGETLRDVRGDEVAEKGLEGSWSPDIPQGGRRSRQRRCMLSVKSHLFWPFSHRITGTANSSTSPGLGKYSSKS